MSYDTDPTTPDISAPVNHSGLMKGLAVAGLSAMSFLPNASGEQPAATGESASSVTTLPDHTLTVESTVSTEGEMPPVLPSVIVKHDSLPAVSVVDTRPQTTPKTTETELETPSATTSTSTTTTTTVPTTTTTTVTPVSSAPQTTGTTATTHVHGTTVAPQITTTSVVELPNAITTPEETVPQETTPGTTTATVPIPFPQVIPPGEYNPTTTTVDTLPGLTYPEMNLRILPELKPITPEINQMLDENTVLLFDTHCSSYILSRDEFGKPDVVSAAEHCDLLDIHHPRKTDAKGSFIELDAPIKIMQGPSKSSLVEIGEAATILVPADSNDGSDMAVLDLSNRGINEVYSDIKTAPELAVGDTAYLGAFPAEQPHSPSGEVLMQKWPVMYIGSMDKDVWGNDPWYVENLKNLSVFAIKKNPVGDKCTPGTSGGAIVTETGGLVGVMSFYVEFTSDELTKYPGYGEMTRKHYENIFKVDLSDYDGLCGVSPLPSVDKLKQFEIRTPEERAKLIAEMNDALANEINDPSKPKTYIDGWMLYPGGGKGPIPLIEDPIIYSHPTGDLLIAWRSYNGSGFDSIPLLFRDLESLFVYRPKDAPEQVFYQSDGELINILTPEGSLAWQDTDGSIFGHLSTDEPIDTVEYHLAIDRTGEPIIFQPTGK